MNKIMLIAGISFLFMGCGIDSPKQKVVLDSEYTAFNSDGYWVHKKDIRENLQQKLEQYIQWCADTEADAVFIAQNNEILAEWYSDDFEGTASAMSTTKSVTALILGVIVKDGLLRTDDLVSQYITEWSQGLAGKVSIEHLLRHMSGLRKARDNSESVGYPAEKNEFVIGLKPVYEPGTRTIYSNEGIQLLSPIMEGVIAGDFQEYIQKRFFNVLGITNAKMHSSGVNNDVWTYADLSISPRDLGRIGQLVCNEGFWGDVQIISGDYIEDATTPIEQDKGYGYAFYIEKLGTYKTVNALGYLHNNMYIIPEKNIVIVRMQLPRGSFSGEDESWPYVTRAKKYIEEILNSVED